MNLPELIVAGLLIYWCIISPARRRKMPPDMELETWKRVQKLERKERRFWIIMSVVVGSLLILLWAFWQLLSGAWG
jgi:hypothetical protein